MADFIEYVAGGHVYAIRTTSERGGIAIHHPDEPALAADGFRVAWADHTVDGGFFVFRRPLEGRAPSPSRDQGTSDARLIEIERLVSSYGEAGMRYGATNQSGAMSGLRTDLLAAIRSALEAERSRATEAERTKDVLQRSYVAAQEAAARQYAERLAEAERERDEALSRAEAAADSASRFWLTEYRERVAAAVRRAEAAEHDRDEAREALDEDRHWLVASQGWLEAAQRRAEAAEALLTRVVESASAEICYEAGDREEVCGLCGLSDGKHRPTCPVPDIARALAAASPSRKGDAT